MSEKVGKKILFINGLFDGHIMGTIDIIKDLISLGLNVTCYIRDKYVDKLKKTGANLKPFTINEKDLVLPPGAPKRAIAGIEISKAYDIIFSDFLKSQDKYDYLIADSFFDVNEMNKIFKIPITISLYAFPIGVESSYIKTGIKQRGAVLIPINKKYNLNIREFISNHYVADAKYKLMLTSKLFHPKLDILNESFYFLGPSIEERPIDPNFNIKKENNEKLIYISLGTIYNEDVSFYLKCIKAFGNSKEFKVILNVGKSIDIKEIGAVPENIYAYNYVPQLQVLKIIDVFITHGGINSINEAFILNNLPIIVIPQEIDQCDNAKQVEKYEAGLALDKHNVTPEILKETVQKFLDNKEKYYNGVKIIVKSFQEARNGRKEILEKLFA